MNNLVIIYDDSCPLCSAYTNAFVKTGLISKEGRKSFSAITPELLKKIDCKRCVNEIPVIDTATRQVWYGIDALLEILQQKMPFIKLIGSCTPVKWVLKEFYKLISYNRRVIVARKTMPGNFDCTPDFSVPYRLLFMVVFLIFNTILLIPLYQYVLQESILNGTSLQQLQLAHTALVCINIFIALSLKKKDGFEYLGQINMLALLIILLSVPLILLNKYTALFSGQLNSFCLGIITLFAILEYIRRMRFIGFIRNQPVVIFINVISASIFFICLGSSYFTILINGLSAIANFVLNIF